MSDATKIWIGLFLSLFTFAMGSFISRNAADEREIHRWVEKVEMMTFENAKSIIRILAAMDMHEEREHREEP